MAYVPGYEYDFFVSYASVDNKPIPPEQRGWVDALVGTLTDELARKLGRREAFNYWMDTRDLRGNHEADNHIPEQAKRAALILVILSPGYLASSFCKLELDTFIQSVGAAGERLFVIYKEEIDERQHTIPDSLRRPVKWQFWYADQNGKARFLGSPLPNPSDPEDKKLYYPKIVDVRNDIANKLIELKRAGPAPAVRSDLPSVLLAETTSQALKERRDELRRYLDQSSIGVLPSGSYVWLSNAELEQALAADLARCAAFVQLLGAEADRFAMQQLEAAKQRGCRILQWRSPDLNLQQSVDSPQQRALLEAIEAMPIDDFKQKILRTIMPAKPAVAPRERNGAPSFIFVDCDSVDIEKAENIGRRIPRDGYDWERPRYESNPGIGELRLGIEKNLVDCDGLLIVQGENPNWVFDQLQLFRKLRQRRTKEARVLAVVQAGPKPAEVRGISLAGLRTIAVDDVANVLAQGPVP
jgi:hypothetical protein